MNPAISYRDTCTIVRRANVDEIELSYREIVHRREPANCFFFITDAMPTINHRYEAGQAKPSSVDIPWNVDY